MKIVGVALFLVIVAVNSDVTAGELPNGDSILTPCGQYIPGSVQRLWVPIFERLGGNLPRCAVGYTKVTSVLLLEVDSSIQCGSAISLAVYFKVYPTIFEAILPFISDKRTFDVLRQIIVQCKPAQAALSQGQLNLQAMNYMFMKWTNDLNDCLDNWQCNIPKPCAQQPTPPNSPSLIDLNLLNGLSLL